MRKLLVTLALFCPVLLALAQDGRPFITDVQLPGDLKGSRIIDMVQDRNETMLYLTRRRLITFDGGHWNEVPMPAAANTLALHKKSGRIFVGLRDRFGELVLNRQGRYELKNLSEQITPDDYRTVLLSDTAAMFIGDEQYVCFSFNRNEILHRGVVATGTPLIGGFVNQNKFALNLEDLGPQWWVNKALKPAPELSTISEDRLIFQFALDSLRTLIGTESDRLLIISGKKVDEVFGPVRNYIKENFLSGGVRLSDTTFAISTLAGGIMVVESRDLRPMFTYNFRTGLPDNEIMAVCTDLSGGLWMAHEFGLSRIDLRQPVMDYSAYPGMEGNAQASLFHRGQLYVGTSNGLFVLSETADLNEIQRSLDRQLEQREQQQAAAPIVVESEPVAAAPEPVKEEVKATVEEKELSGKEKRAQRRAQRKADREKKGKEEEEVEEKPEPVAAKPEPQAKPSTPTGPSHAGGPAGPGGPGGPGEPMRAPGAGGPSGPGSASAGRSTGLTHIYKKVSGIEGKCRQMAAHLDHILVATNTGLYVVSERTAKPIIKGYVVTLSAGSRPGRYLVATSNGLSIVELKGGTWQAESIKDIGTQSVRSAVETKAGVIYIVTDFDIVRLTSDASGSRTPKVFKLPVDQGEDGVAVMVADVPHFVFTSGMFKLSADGTTIETAETEKTDAANKGIRFLKGANNDLWLNSGGAWTSYNSESSKLLVKYLRLFEGIISINADDRGDLWVVDAKSHIYRIRNRSSKEIEPFNLYVRQVGSMDGELFNLDELNISHGNNSLTFEISAPYYLRSNGTEYQYMIDELGAHWSRWSPNPVIEFPLLQGGTYHMRVRARNVFGQLSDEKVLEFTIEPILWLRWYFILLYVLLIVGIIFGIVKVRERGLKETQRILEEMVTNRTSELADEKRKVESLLLNILPKEIADELQKKGQATARHYNMVSVMFTDFKGFTAIAEKTDPEDLVAELDRCFVHFDDIIEKYHLEKIKTIGDSYMCAGGVPIRNKSNALAILLAALEMRQYIIDLIDIKTKSGEAIWEIRIGIHTGPLTAGVVGKKKFAYDIWGDTVNIASRMESSGEAGFINISAATYEHVKHYFDCEPRGKVDTKGKGKMEMYFVNGINAKYSVDGQGKGPTRELIKIMDDIW